MSNYLVVKLSVTWLIINLDNQLDYLIINFITSQLLIAAGKPTVDMMPWCHEGPGDWQQPH